MSTIPDFSLESVARVEFFKRDELTTDIVCCEVVTSRQRFVAHEEMSDWSDLVAKLERLDGFRKDWFSQVSQPPFEECRFVAFARAAP